MRDYIDNRPSGAVFDRFGKYRYTLWRWWKPGSPQLDQMVAFVALNPSTADESVDDPTIRRCRGFAREWGYDGILMLNLFAFRATEPAEMESAQLPIGEENDLVLLTLPQRAGLIVCCWGTGGSFLERGDEVRGMLAGHRVHHLGLTKHGHPKHPLYLRKDTKPTVWL